ncbi:hypothetical protein GCM10017602_09570 [Herbiconiux flava]|nr:hypothetical protein GCM10017602_09570 [Herbiconiux flava]
MLTSVPSCVAAPTAVRPRVPAALVPAAPVSGALVSAAPPSSVTLRPYGLAESRS